MCRSLRWGNSDTGGGAQHSRCLLVRSRVMAREEHNCQSLAKRIVEVIPQCKTEVFGAENLEVRRLANYLTFLLRIKYAIVDMEFHKCFAHTDNSICGYS